MCAREKLAVLTTLLAPPTLHVCPPPQAAVLHLPAAFVPAQRVPAGAHAAGEMEAQVAYNYW